MQSSNQQSNNSQTSTERLRVESVHGGSNVEEISKPEPISDTSYHEHNWVIDSSEKDFTAYMCDDNRCGAVVLYDK